MNPIQMVVSWVLWSLALLAASKCIKGVRLANAKAAFRAAFAYGLLSKVGSVGLWIFFPFIRVLPIVGQLFTFVVVGVPALYVTELFVSDFEVDDLETAGKTALFAAALQSILLLLLR